jgi:hypothetical protein
MCDSQTSSITMEHAQRDSETASVDSLYQGELGNPAGHA